MKQLVPRPVGCTLSETALGKLKVWPAYETEFSVYKARVLFVDVGSDGPNSSSVLTLNCHRLFPGLSWEKVEAGISW